METMLRILKLSLVHMMSPNWHVVGCYCFILYSQVGYNPKLGNVGLMIKCWEFGPVLVKYNWVCPGSGP